MTETFSPEADSIKVGDTLSLESFHSVTFVDASNAAPKELNFGGSVLGTNIRILELPNTSTEVVGAVPSFDIIVVNGHETGNDNIPSENKGFYYQELNSQYLLKLKFIALKKGVYAISVGNSKGIINDKYGCVKADFEIENSNIDNHIYYYQIFRPGYEISNYERTHVYCFKVY